ncbi:MAG: preprotein translocase subunit SecG [Pseudomonadota bacterium]
MESVLIVIHLLVVAALVIVVLLQRSEGGALGMGGGGSNFMSARGAANALSRTTAILAACFFATSILLGILAGVEGGSVLDNLPVQNQEGGTGNGILDQLPGSEGLNLGGDGNTETPQVPTTE